MKGQRVGSEPAVAPTPPEVNLIVAVVQRAQKDIGYQPKPGSPYRSVSSEEQRDAKKFLRSLKAQYADKG
jgi:hypothetical protein